MYTNDDVRDMARFRKHGRLGLYGTGSGLPSFNEAFPMNMVWLKKNQTTGVSGSPGLR